VHHRTFREAVEAVVGARLPQTLEVVVVEVPAGRSRQTLEEAEVEEQMYQSLAMEVEAERRY